MLKIITAPNEVLSQKAKPIIKFDKSLIELIRNMEKTLTETKDPEGVGLAGPQVGKSLQIFIMKPTPKAKITVYINPKITFLKKNKLQSSEQPQQLKKSKPDKTKKLEGCLSLLNIWGEVKRNKQVKLSYLDETGKKHTRGFKDFLATIVQHEYDHLQGVLFSKRVLEQHNQLYRSHKDEKGEDVFEVIKI